MDVLNADSLIAHCQATLGRADAAEKNQDAATEELFAITRDILVAGGAYLRQPTPPDEAEERALYRALIGKYRGHLEEIIREVTKAITKVN